MPDTYNVIVIGGGPGGYVAAIRAGQLGMKVACVENRATLGGTCLNVGCIPSKALLQSSEKFEETQHALAQHGIKVAGVDLDLGTMLARKDKVVSDNVKGIEFLFKKNKVDWIKGKGRITAPGTVQIALNGDGAGSTELKTKSIVIATGSDIVQLPSVEVDEKQVVSS